MSAAEMVGAVYAAIGLVMCVWYYVSDDELYHEYEKGLKLVHGIMAGVFWLPLLLMVTFES